MPVARYVRRTVDLPFDPRTNRLSVATRSTPRSNSRSFGPRLTVPIQTGYLTAAEHHIVEGAWTASVITGEVPVDDVLGLGVTVKL